MTAEEFYLDEYKGVFYSPDSEFEKAVFRFAEAYAEQQNKQLTVALERALEALEDAQMMGDFSDDIEAIKEVLNKEK